MSQHGCFQNAKAVSSLNAVAMQALRVLVRQPSDHTLLAHPGLSGDQIHARLLAVVTAADSAEFASMISALTSRGVSHQIIANTHVPQLARTLGQAWADGTMSFAQVSIGCARLQGYLRQKGLNWCDDAEMRAAPKGSVFLAVPDFEQHTLGATLLAGQLRANGFSVTLAFHAPVEQIVKMAITGQHNAFMISTSCSETLALLGATVQRLKHAQPATPVILGGNALEQGSDFLLRTGADHKAQCWQDVVSILMPASVNENTDPFGR